MKVTIKQIAQRAQVSKSTVSKYLNGGNVEPANRQAVDAAIEQLGGFYPNLLAKGLKTSRTYTVGVMVPYINDIFSATIVAGMERILQEEGYGVIVCSYQGQRELFRKKLTFLIGKMIDSLVVFPSGLEKEDLQIPQYKKIPVVLVDRPLQGVTSDVIMTDSSEVCAEAVHHLLSMGHRKIAVLTGAENSYTSRLRIRGCLNAVEECNLPPETLLIRYGVTTFESGFKNMAALLDEKTDATAVFSTNYYLTFGALSALNARGIRIPEDLSLVGFDTSDLYGVFPVQLTAIEQDVEMLGIQSARVVLDRLNREWNEESRRIIVHARIHYGDSVKNLQKGG